MSEASVSAAAGVEAPGSSLPAISTQAIDETIAHAALRIERGFCALRAFWFAAILLRFWVFSETPSTAHVITSIPITLGIAFSLFVLVAVRRPPRSQAIWLASVSVDAFACFCALLSNAVWPAPGQAGILFMPDTAAIYVATVGAGLRLSWWAALWGGALNAAGLLTLVALDRAVSGVRHEVAFDVVSISVIYLAGCIVIALILASLTRRLARRAAIEALRADRAERGLGAVLSEHHDVGSLLTSAIVDAEVLLADVPAGAADGDRQRVDALARRLLDRLQQIGAVVVDIKSRALGDLNALKEHAPVDVPSAARRAVDALAARHSGVEVRVSAPAEGTVALVAGGSTTLERILVNLLDNACAGDGAGHASEVVVSVRSLTDLGLVEVAVDDDGPGFAPEVLSGAHGQGSVKPGGLGVGLSVVRGLVEACGGVVKLANREPRGASVTVRLPAADAD